MAPRARDAARLKTKATTINLIDGQSGRVVEADFGTNDAYPNVIMPPHGNSWDLDG